MAKETEAERAAIAKFLAEKSVKKLPDGEAYGADGKISATERLVREYLAVSQEQPVSHGKHNKAARANHTTYYIAKKMNNEVDDGK